MQRVLAFEEHLGVHFRDKTLLLRTLTHRSYLNEALFLQADNERLEFLGDAVIDLVVAELLFQRFPEQREGALTAMRSSLVRRETLAQFARRLGIGEFMLMGKGEADSGGRERDAILCAAFEALCGAIFLDQNLESVLNFILPLIDPYLDGLSVDHKDAKSRLQEWAQSELNETPRYVTAQTEGPDHAREFTVEVRVGHRTFGIGKGLSKQRAAQAAAEAALVLVAEEQYVVAANAEVDDAGHVN